MMTKKVLALGPRSRELGPRLAAAFPDVDLRIRPDICGAGDDIAAAQAIVANDMVFNEAIIEQARQLEWIQALTTGIDTVLACRNLSPATVITTARGIHGPQMSELVFLFMLGLSRQFPRMLANQAKRHWEQWPAPVLAGKMVTVLGTGAISEALAQRCQAFGMQVCGISASPRPVPGFDQVLPRDDLKAAVALADFFVILVPLSPETQRIVDRSVIAALKPSAYLINVSRGGVIDEAALIDALSARRIAGAGLDVFSVEPLPPEDPLWELDNVILSPKVGGTSTTYENQVMPIIAQNMRAWLAGDAAGWVNRMHR